RIEFEPTGNAPPDLASRLAGRLQAWTGARWGVSIAAGGGATIAERRDAEQARRQAGALEIPLVKAIFDAFPGATIHGFKDPVETESEVAEAALPEVEDEWDPFEDY
ncbi:MAG: DNA polymerase III subunit gamma/tau, partial [Pararhodobacter sp.]|nr:DNA polymerase III subunit gamma/tau [Pararhodobacter sp.]